MNNFTLKFLQMFIEFRKKFLVAYSLMGHPSVLHGIIDGRTVRLKLAYELLEVNPHKFVFAGKRTIRGIPADVWVAEKLPDNSDDPYSTIEIFFADPKYTVQIEEVNEMKSVPLGMITHHASSITAPSFHSKVVNHYYHFTNSPPHWKVGGLSPLFSQLWPTEIDSQQTVPFGKL